MVDGRESSTPCKAIASWWSGTLVCCWCRFLLEWIIRSIAFPKHAHAHAQDSPMCSLTRRIRRNDQRRKGQEEKKKYSCPLGQATGPRPCRAELGKSLHRAIGAIVYWGCTNCGEPAGSASELCELWSQCTFCSPTWNHFPYTVTLVPALPSHERPLGTKESVFLSSPRQPKPRSVERGEFPTRRRRVKRHVVLLSASVAFFSQYQ